MSVRTKFVSLFAVSALALGACQSPPNENPSTETSEEGTLTFENAVVREKGEDKDMTGIFGDLVNDSEDPIIVESFSTDLTGSDIRYEIHETTGGVMQEMTDPLVIQPGETRVFEPGGDHFMIMNHPEPILAGDVVVVTLDLSTGGSVDVEVPVRALGAGDEDYGEDGQLQGHNHGGDEGHGSH